MKYTFTFIHQSHFTGKQGSGIINVYVPEKYKNIDDASIAIFLGMPIREIPKFLRAIKEDSDAHYHSYIKFMYGPLYEERYMEPTLDVKEDEVTCDSEYGSTICKRQEFEERALAFAHKSLEAVVWFGLLEKGLVDNQWIADIKAWILAHEDRILVLGKEVDGTELKPPKKVLKNWKFKSNKMQVYFIFRSQEEMETFSVPITTPDEQENSIDFPTAVFTELEIEEIPRFLKSIVKIPEPRTRIDTVGYEFTITPTYILGRNFSKRRQTYIMFYIGPFFHSNQQITWDIKQDEVSCGGHDADSWVKIKKQEFEERALAFANKSLEAVVWFGLLEKGLVDNQWIADIKAWILAHEDRILGQSADDEAV